MARLQWNPLPITDIGESALRAQAMAGASIQNAFSGITGALNQWEGARREDVLADITRQQMSFTDPNDFKAALADGRINLNSDYLRPEDMMRVAGYQDTLTSRRNAERSFVRDEQEYTDRQDDRRELKANTAQGLQIAKTVAQLEADLADNRISQAEYDSRAVPLIQSATAAGHIETVVRGRSSGIQSSRDGARFTRDIRDSDYGYNRRVTTDNRDDVTYTDQQAARTMIDELTRNGGSILDLEQQQNFINATPGARLAAREMAGSLGVQPGTAGSFAGAGMGPGGDDYSQMLVALESGGDPSAQPRNPDGSLASSATGLHQFTRNTWLNTVKDLPWAQGKTEAELLALRTNPEYSAEAELVLRNANAAALARANIPANNVNLYAMHHFSPQEAMAFARADGNTPTASLFSTAVIAANPYLRGKTKDEVIANWDRRTNGAASRNTSRVNASVAGASVADANDHSSYMAQPAFIAALNSQDSHVAVISRLRAEGGPFENMSERELGAEIRKIQERYAAQNGGAALPSAAAGMILENNLKSYDLGRDFFGQITGRVRTPGSGRSLNLNDIDQSLALIRPDRNGRLGLADSLTAAQGRAASIAQTPAMQAELQALQAQIRQMEMRDTAPGGNPNNPATARLRQQANRLQYSLSQQFSSNEAAINPSSDGNRFGEMPTINDMRRLALGR